MLRVVIDTNVVVKGLFVKNSKQGFILEQFLGEKINMIYSLEMVRELLKVINYPKIRKSFVVRKDWVEKYIESVKIFGRVVVPEETDKCRDVKDNMVLGTAMAGARFGLTYLITEDEDLLELDGKVENMEIVTPGEFLKAS